MITRSQTDHRLFTLFIRIRWQNINHAVELNRDSTGQMQRIIALGAMIRLNAGTQDLTSPLSCANFVLTKARARQLLQRDFLVLMKTEQ